MLNNALNKGNKPPVIADRIEVIELEMGTQPPELEIRDIGELTMDQFRGIFRLTYAGDAHIVLKTKVQANPLNHKQPDIHLMTGSRGMLAAKQPLVVPMLLRLSHFKLNSYVVLVVSKQKGITLVFKTDPLQNVDINSTFDSIAVIQKFIQREIEGQLRQMFREDLPGIIHRLSQQWVKAKVEAPYLKRPGPAPHPRPYGALSAPEPSLPPLSPSPSVASLPRQYAASGRRPPPPRSVSGVSMTSTSHHRHAQPPSTPASPPEGNTSTFPDLENFDPTYGLRPEGLPTKSLFHGFGSLFTPNKGLADLAEESSDLEESDEGIEPFDVVDWRNPPHPPTPPDSVAGFEDDRTEYETIPAIGGGTVTRPRVIHSQSPATTDFSPPRLAPNSSLPGRSMSYDRFVPPRSAGLPMSGFATPGLYSTRSPSFSYFSPEFMALRQEQQGGHFTASSFPELSISTRLAQGLRPTTPDSLETQPSRSSMAHSLETPPSSHPSDVPLSATEVPSSPIYMRKPTSRRGSMSSGSALPDPFTSSVFLSSSPPESSDPKIVLKPASSSTIHQLSTLSHSNHTLSPYVRSLEHFTVRSVPPRGLGHPGPSSLPDRQPVKARRKRTHRLGKKNLAEASGTDLPDISAQSHNLPRLQSMSHTPPSEFDVDDMDTYFRTRDDYQLQIIPIITTLLERCSVIPRIVPVDDGFLQHCLDDAAAHGCPMDDSTPGHPSFKPWNVSGATIAFISYGHLECLSTKKYIALFTSLAVYIEDVYKDDPSLINGFNQDFIMNRPQKTSVLQAFDICIRESSAYFSPLQANLIVSSTLNFMVSISVEHMIESIQISPSADKFPEFVRGLSGIAFSYAIFIFPRAVRMDAYMQAIPSMSHYINHTNDVLSFYKEEIAGEDHNYVSIIAKCRKTSKLKILEELAHSVTSSHSTVANILSEFPQALQAWKSFAEGYVSYHTSFARYRLEEVLDVRNVSSGKL
ncbi:hypothetical protein ONZ45_g6825 [Pleurotus djamor]|nr:hypothetical protein ONZ45_g6825 [Pleurotus djamor]